MKKIIFIFTCIFVSLFIIGFKSKSYADDTTYFETSDNFKFSADEVVIYSYDLEDINFNTSQEVIDFIFERGYNRTNLVDERRTIFGAQLTTQEIKLLTEYPAQCVIGWNCSKKAEESADELFPSYSGDSDLKNAYKHAYWVMLMYYHTSPEFAKLEAYAHEEYDSNPALEKKMDLTNDDTAYNLCLEHENLSDTSCAAIAYKMVYDGKLVYILRNYKYLSQVIYYPQTKQSKYIYKTDDFLAYTNMTTPISLPSVDYVNATTPGGNTVISL